MINDCADCQLWTQLRTLGRRPDEGRDIDPDEPIRPGYIVANCPHTDIACTRRFEFPQGAAVRFGPGAELGWTDPTIPN